MARKRYTAEEIIGQLRTIEIELGKGLAVVEACRKLGITEQNCGMHGSTAVETVAAYGKATPKAESVPSGTVTETGTGEGKSERKDTEVIERVGAGDGI